MVALSGDAPDPDAYKAPALLLSYGAMEIPVRFGLTFKELQSFAFPLGYGTIGSRSGSRTLFIRLMRPLEITDLPSGILASGN